MTRYFRVSLVNFGLKLVAIDGPIANVHEVFEGKTIFAEVMLCSVFAGVADIEFILEIEIVGNFTPIHPIIIKLAMNINVNYQLRLSNSNIISGSIKTKIGIPIEDFKILVL